MLNKVWHFYLTVMILMFCQKKSSLARVKACVVVHVHRRRLSSIIRDRALARAPSNNQIHFAKYLLSFRDE